MSMVAAPPVSRIVITGSECTGKTTLAEQLARELATLWVPEFARQYALDVARPLGPADVEPIARGQLEAEDRALEHLAQLEPRPRVIVLDTDLVSTVVYAHHYYGGCPQWIVDAAQRRLGDVYLLSEIDVPWTADGVRDRPAARAEIHELFRQWLSRLGALVFPVAGLGRERLAAALDALERARLIGSAEA
jgi:NadR type nicotinamide-nucleotide adenylyltransferase